MFEANIFAIIERIVIRISCLPAYFGIFGGEKKIANMFVAIKISRWKVVDCVLCIEMYAGVDLHASMRS